MRFFKKIYQKIRRFLGRAKEVAAPITMLVSKPKLKNVPHNRKVKLIVIHCTASDNPKHDNITVIRQWHLARGWRDVGYHYLIRKNGQIEKGRDESVAGAHVKGYNKHSIGICFSGEHKFTEAQFISGRKLIKSLLDKYELTTHHVAAHNEFTNYKTCPNFDIDVYLLSRLNG